MGTTLASLVTNKRRVSALKSLGIVTVGDALTYYPFRVTEPVPLRAIREAAPGQQMAFAAVIRDMRVVPMNARRGYRLEATVDDADFARSRRAPGSTARLTFFSYRKSYVDWVSMRLRAGTSVVVSGTPGKFGLVLLLTEPVRTTLASLVTNKRRVSALKSLGIVTVGDALTYYPFRVTEPVPLRAIREAAPGQQMAFAAVIRDMRVVPMNARRGWHVCGGLRYARRIHGSAAVHPSRNPHCRARVGRNRSGA